VVDLEESLNVSHLPKGEGIPLKPKGDPDEIVVLVDQECSGDTRRSTIAARISGQAFKLVGAFILGAAAGFALAQFIVLR
jgi:hypothetical protein